MSKRVESVRAYGWERDGVLQDDAVGERYNRWRDGEKTVRVRIIRETDWFRLLDRLPDGFLKAAKREE